MLAPLLKYPGTPHKCMLQVKHPSPCPCRSWGLDLMEVLNEKSGVTRQPHSARLTVLKLLWGECSPVL